MRTASTTERRHYTCQVCGRSHVIEVKLIEKWVVVCAHGDTRGSMLPVMQLKDEGRLVLD